MIPTTRLFQRHFGIVVALVLIAVIGISVVAAQQLNFPDGRINQVAFFGGDALYCIDKNYFVTDNYDIMISGGGFRLLNKTGQELWFVPAADVTKASEQSTVGGAPVLIAKGQGSYGEAALYATRAANGDIFFIFSGFDEHGKPNSFAFTGCGPRGGAAPAAVPTVEPTAVVTREVAS